MEWSELGTLSLMIQMRTRGETFNRDLFWCPSQSALWTESCYIYIYKCLNVNAASFRSAGVSFSALDDDDDADAVNTLYCCLELLFGL